jgi:peroxiredoxin
MAAMAWLLVHLLGQNGRLLVRFDQIEEALAEHDIEILADEEDAQEEDGLRYADPAPTFDLPGVHGETMTLDALCAQGKPVLLVFSDPGCGPCNALMPDIRRWQREQAARLTVAVISSGAVAANKAKSDEHGLINVLIQEGREINGLYRVGGTPTGILVRADGAIGSRAAVGAEEIRALVKQIAGNPSPAPMPAANGREPAAPAAPSVSGPATIGMPAPAVLLPDLDGRTVALGDFHGQPTVVLFWNPTCGFCQRMLPDLKAWEESPPQGAPKLLLVSTGNPEANRAQGLRSPIVLDEEFQTGTAFGAGGTPSAVLIDERGNVASNLGVGAPEVLGLLNVIDPTGCETCVAECKEQGGGEACVTVCMMAGKCG